MDKVVEFIKKNKVKVAGALIMIAAFVILLIINLHVDYTSDDFRYRFIYDTPGNPLPTTKKISSFWDVIISMINHWKLCNGRVVAHGLLQMVMPFGKLFFRIFNSLVYVSLGFLIYKHSVYGKKSNLSLLVLVYIGMWFFLPQFGLSVMWASGAANYLWCAAIMLSFMLPYRMYAANGADSVKDSWKSAVLMGLFGLFAGCTNENTGGGVVLICTLFILFYKIKGFKIPKWSWIGVITAVCGVVLLLAAPGNYRIDSKASFAEILIRFKDVIAKTETLAFWLFVIIAVVLILALLGSNPYYTALTPVIHNTYWYFTAYFALFFFIPFINKGMRDITIKQAYAVIISVIFVYIALPYFAKVDLFKLEKGYSATWIIFLYVIGAALKKIKIEKLIRNKYWYLILYVLTAVMAWGGKFISEYHTKLNGGFKNDEVFLQYNSIFILLSGMFLVLFFANLNINNDKFKKVIRFLAPAAFGVYIIHVNPLMFQLPFWGKLMQLSQKPLYLMVLGVLLNSLIVFVLCLAADLVRIQLFRLLHINKFLDLISDWLSKYMNLFCEKVKKCSDGNSVNNKKLSQGKLKDR